MKSLAAALCILLACSLHAQRNIFDGFDDNDNGWPETMTESNKVFVKNGHYTVQSKSEGYFRHTFTVNGGFEKHFRIEVAVARDSSVPDEKGAGIVWGRAHNDSTYMAFLVYGDGSFVFENRVRGKLNVVSPNAFNYAFNGDGLNGIRVERNMATNQYEFSINEQLVLAVPYVQPLSNEVGIHLDLAANYSVDNFWFVEQADQPASYQPAALRMSDVCGDESLLYTSDYGYTFCVPFGWRVDEYRETHCTVWPLGFPYVVNTDYTRLAIEDSFSTAARNDFKIYCDSMHVKKRQGTTFRKSESLPGVEVYAGTYSYTGTDGIANTTYRYYVYHKQTGGFLLAETIIPMAEQEYSGVFSKAAHDLAASMQWK